MAFQLQNLTRYLDRLEADLGDAGESYPLRPILEHLMAFDLADFEKVDFTDCFGCPACMKLANLLDEIVSAAYVLSERLAMRHFTHIRDVGRQTLAA